VVKNTFSDFLADKNIKQIIRKETYLERCDFHEAVERSNKLKLSIFQNCSLVMKITIKIEFYLPAILLV
jgi:hypothetical protein